MFKHPSLNITLCKHAVCLCAGPASTSPTVPSGSSAAGPHDDVRGTVQLGMLTVNPHGLDSGEHALNDDVRGTVQSGELTVNPHLSDEDADESFGLLADVSASVLTALRSRSG